MKKIHLRVTFIQGMNFIPLTRIKMFHSRLRRSCKRSLERYHSKGHRIKLVYLCYLHSRGSKGQLWGSCSTEPADNCSPVHTDPEAHTPVLSSASAQSDPPSTAKSKTDSKLSAILRAGNCWSCFCENIHGVMQLPRASDLWDPRVPPKGMAAAQKAAPFSCILLLSNTLFIPS